MTSPRLSRGRFSQAGACYAITTVLAQRRPLFALPGVAALLRLHLDGSSELYGFDTLAWVAMPDHAHIVLQLHDGVLGRAIQAFKSRTARAINRKLTSSGAVWQAGFYDHCLRDEEDLRRHTRYVLENPVRRGLVERPEDYPHWGCRWPSHSAL